MSIMELDRKPAMSGADLVFPEYPLKVTRRELLLQSKRKHHQALAEVMLIAQQSCTYDYERRVEGWSDPDSEMNDWMYSRAETSIYESYAQLIEMLEGLETDTLTFIAESYNGKVTKQYSDALTTALDPRHFAEAKNSGEDINLLVKNVISYRKDVISIRKRDIDAFNDVRASGPELNRPDLYNLTGDNREWVKRIMSMATYSREYPHEGDTSLHSSPEIAALIKDDDEILSTVYYLISTRGINPAEITTDLIDSIRSSEAPVLNGGIL